MSKILGIDLGTTNSCMSVIEGGQPKVIENKEGARTTPSMTALAKNGERLVGASAKRQAVTNPEHTLFSVKRLIGRRWDDPEVQRDLAFMPYKIVKHGDGVAIRLGDKEHTPEEISAMILRKLKEDAEERLGEKVTEAVITVPAYFDDAQRNATKVAGEIAERIINEPTAAALAYGFDKKVGQKILVYDLGGGTFDVSVLDVSEDTVEVKATNGDTHLGGDDFDRRIIEWIIAEFKKQEGMDLGKDPLALQRIKDAAEKAKIELSTTQQTEVNQPFISSDANGPKHLTLTLTRSKLEEIVGDLVEKTFGPVRSALQDAKLGKEDIQEIVMVGGMTRMPLIQKKVEDFFGKKPNVSVNPDEVVALGAAVQGGVLAGEVRDVLLLDVTPLSLGIETLGSVMTVLIARNTTVPTNKSQIFSTAADGQTSVEIHVLQGERPMATDNKTLGRFILSDIPPSSRGLPQIEVKFDIDANGILHVSATDKATNKKQEITITASTGLSKDEIERMKKEAEMHAQEDEKKREYIEHRNIAETMIYTAEKMLRDAGEKVTAEERKEVEEKITALKQVMEGDDHAVIKKAADELSESAQKVGAKMYASQEGQGAQGGQEAHGTQGGQGGTEEPIDAEFKEKNEDKPSENN